MSWMEDIPSLPFLRLINSSLPSGSLTRPLGTLSQAGRSTACPPQTSAGAFSIIPHSALHGEWCEPRCLVRGLSSLTCYSPNGHGVLFRRGHGHHDVVHVSQVLPMRQVDGLPFPVHPVFGEPGLFEIHRVPGVQDQRVHDGAGHQLDHSCALLPGAGGLRVGLRGWWAVIILHRRH